MILDIHNYNLFILIIIIYVYISDFRTWWEIPTIVHFCKYFSPFCEDLCPIDITVST